MLALTSRAPCTSSGSTSGPSRHARSSCPRRTAPSLGSASHAYRSGVIERALPATGAPLPAVVGAAGPPGLAGRARGRGARRGRRRRRRLGDDRRDRNRLHRLDPASRDAATGMPLCRLAQFVDRPHAYPKLWKHHAAQPQAERVTAVAATRGEPWLARYGGRISSEWQFAKALQVLEEDREIYEAAEPLDRGRGLDRLAALRPRDAERVHRRVQGALPGRLVPLGVATSGRSTRTSSTSSHGCSNGRSRRSAGAPGDLTREAAGTLGLPEGIAVSVGNVDAHVTAPAACAVEPGPDAGGDGHLDVPRHERRPPRRGARDVRRGRGRHHSRPSRATRPARAASATCSPGSSSRQLPGAYRDAAAGRGLDPHEYLSELASAQAPGEHGLVALDWLSGNRSVLVDHELSGAIVGLTLGTRPEDMYRALVEATAFGARTIIETFDAAGVPVRELTVAGGLVKNAFLMQVYADVLRRPLHVVESDQAPALGSAIHAAVAAGCHARRARGGERDGTRPARRLRPRLRRGRPLRRALRPLHDAPRPVRAAEPHDARAAAADRAPQGRAGRRPWRRSAPSSRGSTRSCRDTAS